MDKQNVCMNNGVSVSLEEEGNSDTQMDLEDTKQNEISQSQKD
jgi:hypothetical protein